MPWSVSLDLPGDRRGRGWYAELVDEAVQDPSESEERLDDPARIVIDVRHD